MERHLLSGLDDAPALVPASVVTIGVFDGVHLGHQTILDRLVDIARERGLPSVCVTFSVHPREVLAGEAPHSILSLEHRLELLERRGVDHAVVVEFSRAFAAVDAETFVDRLLVRALGVRELVLGHDTTVGRDRRGDAAFLTDAGRRHGFGVVTVGGVTVDGAVVSSSRVRAAISSGDIDTARRLLGRPPSLLGTVVHGDGRGATIGFPTANLEVHSEAFPPYGVYAVTARCLPGDPAGAPVDLPAVMNFGTRPTFHQDDTHAVFEIHVLDRDDLQLYDQRMEVFLHAFLRRERRFDGVDDLVAQIGRDCTAAREIERTLPEG